MLDKIVQWQIDHPAATGLLVAVIIGSAGLHAYRIGFTLAEIRGMHGEAARAASEALGG